MRSSSLLLGLPLALGLTLASSAAAAPAPSKRVLFVCTGNFYRSRFAEAVFNYSVARSTIPALKEWSAFSRGLGTWVWVHHGLSKYAAAELQARGIPVSFTAPEPAQLTSEDLQKADLVVLMNGAEHWPMLKSQFPDGPLDKVIAWDVPDEKYLAPSKGLGMVQSDVDRLLGRLSTGAASPALLQAP